MNWAVIAGLVLQYGLPFVEKLIAKWSSNSPVTLAEFSELTALASQNAQAIMLARLKAANIDPASDQGKILLGLSTPSV